MRLINVHSLEMKEFLDYEVPPYVILSHRWEDDEISFQHFELDKGQRKSSYHKIQRLCQIASQDSVDWIWLDTCCIDKRNSTELSEAINSMYRWYQKSKYCVAYLHDIDNVHGLALSSWFGRCWTLQELIAPSEVHFYSQSWTHLGRKSDMVQLLSSRTGIDEATLRGADPRRCSVAQRMSWASQRKATRVEDEAYSLLGLFDISMPMLYGDGKRAFQTLQERIIQVSDDQSIFAWQIGYHEIMSYSNQSLYGLLAISPSAFAECWNITKLPKTATTRAHGFSFTSVGVHLTLPTRPYKMRSYEVALECTDGSKNGQSRVVIFIQELAEAGEFARIEPFTIEVKNVDLFREDDPVSLVQKMHTRHRIQNEPISIFYGFRIRNIQFPYCRPQETADALVFSRNGKTMQYSREPLLSMMPPGSYGTVAVIIPPSAAPRFFSPPVRCLHFGFDSEFNPFCIVDHSASGTKRPKIIRAFHKSPEDCSNAESQERYEKLKTLDDDIRSFDDMFMKANSDTTPWHTLNSDANYDFLCVPNGLQTTPATSMPYKHVSRGGVVPITNARKKASATTGGSRDDQVVKVSNARGSVVNLYYHHLVVHFRLMQNDKDSAWEPSKIWEVEIVPDCVGFWSTLLLTTTFGWLWNWGTFVIALPILIPLWSLRALYRLNAVGTTYMLLIYGLGFPALIFIVFTCITISNDWRHQPLTAELVRGLLNGTISKVP